jgi:hypothetical protein
MFSIVVITSQQTNCNGIICLHPLHDVCNLLLICFISVGISKGTPANVSGLAEGIDAPSANTLPAA